MPRSISAALRPARQDLVLAGLMIGVGLADAWLAPDLDRLAASAGAIVMGGAMAWRRLLPVAVVVVVAIANLIVTLNGIPVDGWVFMILVFVVAVYSLGAYTPSLLRSLAGLTVTLAFLTVTVYVNDGPGADNLGFAAVMVAAPWIAGRLVRRRTEQAVQLAHRAEELERSAAEQQRLAIAEERARIARELHDIISHSVSVMTVQAGAIEEVIDHDQEAARTAAASIRQAGRQALTDLRTLLGLLRDDGNAGDRLDPQPGLDDLATLVDQVRKAGLEVDLEIEGQPRPLPPAIDLSAYRVVQEALTNTLRHARASRVDVRVRFDDALVEIEVTDDGSAVPTGTAAGGHGLIGMRERMALHAGELQFGLQPSGGYRVRAVLPASTESS